MYIVFIFISVPYSISCLSVFSFVDISVTWTTTLLEDVGFGASSLLVEAPPISVNKLKPSSTWLVRTLGLNRVAEFSGGFLLSFGSFVVGSIARLVFPEHRLGIEWFFATYLPDRSTYLTRTVYPIFVTVKGLQLLAFPDLRRFLYHDFVFDIWSRFVHRFFCCCWSQCGVISTYSFLGCAIEALRCFTFRMSSNCVSSEYG